MNKYVYETEDKIKMKLILNLDKVRFYMKYVFLEVLNII